MKLGFGLRHIFQITFFTRQSYDIEDFLGFLYFFFGGGGTECLNRALWTKELSIGSSNYNFLIELFFFSGHLDDLFQYGYEFQHIAIC